MTDTISRRPDIHEITPVPPTPVDVDWCSRFDDYAERVGLVSRVVTERGGFRFPARIVINDDAEEFVIEMREGADLYDLRYARGIVREIKSGHYREYPWTDSQDGAGNAVHSVVIGYGIPRGWRSGSEDKLVLCRNQHCVSYLDLHTYVDDDPDLVEHTVDVPDGAFYSIEVHKFGLASWVVEVDTTQEMSPEDARPFANDLSWAAAEADKLNRLEESASQMGEAA